MAWKILVYFKRTLDKRNKSRTSTIGRLRLFLHTMYRHTGNQFWAHILSVASEKTLPRVTIAGLAYAIGNFKQKEELLKKIFTCGLTPSKIDQMNVDILLEIKLGNAQTMLTAIKRLDTVPNSSIPPDGNSTSFETTFKMHFDTFSSQKEQQPGFG